MYKNRFGINNLQWLMFCKTKPNQTMVTQVQILDKVV